MPTQQELAEKYLIKNSAKTNYEVARVTNVSERTVQRARAKLLAENKISDRKEIEKTIEEKVEERRNNAKIKLLQDQNKKLILEYDKLMEQYDHALLIKERVKVVTPKIVFNTSINNQATPIIQFSDWHVEERIERSTTHGKNEFNPDIAAKRVDTLTLNTLKNIKKERQDVKINEIVICLGGDFINNFLHEHDVQMNFMHPIEAAIFAKTLLYKSLSTLAKNGDFKRIVVLCIRGNHGRLTKKMQSSNDYKMNLEAIIYYMLKQELNDSVFEWHIPESQIGYVNVYGKVIRAFHGHEIKFQGGVGDLTIPANKFIMKQDKTEKADWNLMHHYHSFWTPTRNTSLNGSLCGWNSYALSLGLPYEPALQTFHLLDAKRGFTVRTPIHCE
jgi:hypothetical protein